MNPSLPKPNADPDIAAEDGSFPFEVIQELCTTFVQQSDVPDRPSLHSYIQKVAAAARPTLLRNLLHIEVARRRAKGEQPAADEYLNELPSHATLIKQVFLELFPDRDRITLRVSANGFISNAERTTFGELSPTSRIGTWRNGGRL